MANEGLTDGTYRGPVKKQLLVVVFGLLTVLLAAGQLARAATAPARPTPEDTLPMWSWDARFVAFEEQVGAARSVHSTPAAAGKVRYFGGGIPRGFQPHGNVLLVQRGSSTFWVGTVQIVAWPGIDATWSPDGTLVAYLQNRTLYVSNNETVGEGRAIATGIDVPSWDVTGPVWSPDGSKIVVASGPGLVVADVAGGNARVVFSGENQSVNPTWSADGSTIAFERNAGAHWSIWTMAPDGSDAHLTITGNANFRYPRFSPSGDGLAFISDNQHIPGGATQYRFALYEESLSNPRLHKLVDDVHPYSPPAWSPTGAQLAVAAGQECKRWGIFVIRSDAPFAGGHRRSNQCRFEGTARGERLTGTPWYDILRGYGGNDVISGGGGNDRIEGDAGNDVIDGGPGNDAIFGGPGDDRIDGGAGNHLIIPGNGHDVVDCGPGIDTVEGTGPLDHIAKNCEHVRH
jgi:Ca2+-binding RTX toxin-like protein